MISERKYLARQNVSYLLIVYYSIFSVLLAVFSDFYSERFYYFEEITTTSSVLVLVASLLATGFRFEARAAVFRDCYLKLQKLEAEQMPEESKSSRYVDLLLDYPNHTEYDYHDFVIKHTYWDSKTLTSGNDTVKPTHFMWLSYSTRKASYYALLIVLLIAPLFILLNHKLCG